MPETEPKINVHAKQHLQIQRRIENPAKHPKWPEKKLLAITIFKDTTICLTGI